MNKPKVSVCVVTYNQKAYIAQCLQSIIDQQTDFEFEVIVGDDASTDGTTEIVNRFAREHPNRIRFLRHPNNIGPCGNYIAVHAEAVGKYIAHVDGDDYAVAGKLQAQADYLDAHPDKAIVWHRMLVLDEASGRIAEDMMDVSKLSICGFTQRDVAELGCVGWHSSVMFRASAAPKHYPDGKFLDYWVTMQILSHGNGGMLPSVFGTYRIGSGIARSNWGARKVMLENLQSLCKQYPHCRRNFSCLTILMLLVDIVQRRPTLRLSLQTAIRTFHPMFVFRVIATWNVRRMLKLPAVASRSHGQALTQ